MFTDPGLIINTLKHMHVYVKIHVIVSTTIWRALNLAN